MKLKTLLALAAALCSALPPTLHAESQTAWERIVNDLGQITRVADADFWRGIYDVGTSVDFNIDPTGVKVIDASFGLAAGVGLTSYGVIKEMAVRKYPELSVADATELYAANLKRRMSLYMAKHHPRLYRPPVGVNLAEELKLKHPPTRRFGGWIDHPWSNRIVFMGGGAVLSLAMIAYLMMIDVYHPNFNTDAAVQKEIEQIARADEARLPLDTASLTDDDFRDPKILIRLLAEGRSVEAMAQLAQAHPQLAAQIHDLAITVAAIE